MFTFLTIYRLKSYWLPLVLLSIPIVIFGQDSPNKKDCSKTLASLLTPSRTWENIESLEEQPIVYLGGHPRLMALSLPLPKNPQIPNRIKKLAENELLRILKKLNQPSAEFETWVTYNDWGNYTWAIARYRAHPKASWQWLDQSFKNPEPSTGPSGKNRIIVPVFLDKNHTETWDKIFNHYPLDLYQRPSFGSAIWLKEKEDEIVHAWLPPKDIEIWEKILTKSKLRPVIIPPPSRMGESPITFIVSVNSTKVKWPQEIEWFKEKTQNTTPIPSETQITSWPHHFTERYLDYVKQFSEGKAIHSPLTGKIIDVGKLGVGQKDNQILDLVAYLKQHYEKQGFNQIQELEVVEQSFLWRGIPQANLIAKIKGSLPPSKNKPVILSDHIDKAIAEDIYEKKGQRITNPGADDNATATAAVLMASEILIQRFKNAPPLHDIWLVHFTGEEYPGSSLGARYFISDLLSKGIDIGANINMDMMGHRTQGDKIFQINPGATESSQRLAQIALQSAKIHASQWAVKIRSSWAKNSYITQTDSTFFDYAGYPTILINEHINLSRRINPHYHQSNDTYEKVDLNYATSQAKVAIETAAKIANAIFK